MDRKKLLAAAALLLPVGMAAVVTVTPITEGIFRIDGEATPKPTQAIALERQVVPHIEDNGNVVNSNTATVKVDEETGAVSFYNKEGDLLLKGLPAVSNDSVTSLSFVFPEGVNFYGAGERGHSLRLNGDTLSFYNRQNYGYTEGDPRISQMGISVPWLMTDRGYGIFFDDYGKAEIALGDTVTYTTNSPEGISYYLVNGNTLADGIENYTLLTGRQPLPPLWALGYITSKYGYHTQDETLGVIDTLKTRGYPVDGIVLDLYWYGKETDMGRLEWNKEQWPDHKAMLDSLKSMGVNTVLITQPYINKIGAIDNYNLLDSLGLLTHDAEGNTHDVTTWVGEAGMFDMANPATREWLWNRLRPLTAEGVAGWWGDLGEPEVHPATIIHASGETAEQFHNVYGNVWSKLIYDGLRKDFPDMRPLLMMRGGTAGLQRYGVMPWTTDVSRSWGGLQPQVKLMLTSGLSGLGYMSSDIGGFAVDPENPTDEELYIRWLQMGTFTPTLRTHAQHLPEPYHYPEIEDIAKRYIKMRYEWLPYNYTLAYENAALGWPLARPLNFFGDNPDEKYADMEDEYLWGSEVLVAPVMQQGATSRKVVFPAGEWIDFFDPDKRYAGSSEAVVDAPLDKIPLFVKAGSFIPLYLKPVENVEGYDRGSLTVRYYPSTEASVYTMVEDDGKNPTALEDEEYTVVLFGGVQTPGKINIEIDKVGGYRGMPQQKDLTMEIIGTDRPKAVRLDSRKGKLKEIKNRTKLGDNGWYYDPISRVLTINFPWGYSYENIDIEM